MGKWAGAAAVTVLVACVDASALAQGKRPDADARDTATAGAPTATPRQHQIYRGSKVIGSTVRDGSDRDIGMIKDLILDAQRGEVAYAVVSFGGVMGVGRKYHAIPWKALDPGDDGRYYVLHADKQTIAAAPGFDKAKWPDMTEQRWSAEVDRYWSRMVGSGMSRHNNLTSSGVSNPQESGGATSSGR